MNHIRQAVSLTLVLALLSLGLTAQAQRRTAPRLSYAQIGDIISRVESDSDNFRSQLNSELDNGTLGAGRQQNINTYVNDFDSALRQLRDRYDRRAASAADAQFLLDRATLVDNAVNRNRVSTDLANNWANVRADLNELARAYGIYWRPGTAAARPAYPANNPPFGTNNPPYNQPYGNQRYGGDAMLTGTYRLESSQSDDPRRQAESATSRLPYRDRQRVMDELMTRLNPPDALAIERRGRTVTIASTRAPQITFEADGVERTETLPSGRTVRAVARLYGNQLTVSTTGSRDTDFSVTFDPADSGQRLFVTRRLSDVDLSQPVTVRSVYTRTADVAQFDIYNGAQPGYQTTGGYGNNSNGAFVVPNNTTLVAVLNTDLTTANAHEGDRFTLTVRDPAQYDGATIEGTVGHVQRSGRVTGRSELALNFDTIRLRDGSSYRFAGIIESVRAANGENVRVDNEGTVQENDSRGQTTAQRAAIGTAVGAIIGAIAGGGKGAAIGAILGAGGGAGSVYVQGQDDLSLSNGTEVTIRATGPNNR